MEWVVWPLEVTAGGRVPCREEGKGWLAGLAVVCCFLLLVTVGPRGGWPGMGWKVAGRWTGFAPDP